MATPVNPVQLSSAGAIIQPDSWARSFAYNADSTLNYEQITDGTSVWRRTYTYSGGLVTAITAWVLQ